MSVNLEAVINEQLPLWIPINIIREVLVAIALSKIQIYFIFTGKTKN